MVRELFFYMKYNLKHFHFTDDGARMSFETFKKFIYVTKITMLLQVISIIKTFIYTFLLQIIPRINNWGDFLPKVFHN